MEAEVVEEVEVENGEDEEQQVMRPDPMSDLRLANIPAHDPNPKPNRKAEKVLLDKKNVYYFWEYLGSIAAWGHISSEILFHLCPRVPAEIGEELLDLMWQSGVLRRYTDCPNCRSIQIWSLRAGQALQRAINSQPIRHQQGFFGVSNFTDENPTSLCPPAELVKHDFAAAELACRLSEFLPAGWILGARDARCSSLLRLPKPEKHDTAWRQKRKNDSIERWGDIVYIRKSDGLRIVVEVTHKQNKSQLASKARWWGVSIAERGGAEAGNLRAVILDPPQKDIANKAICEAFPRAHGWDEYRESAAKSVLYAKWEEWVDGDSTPAMENRWRAYYPRYGKTETAISLLDLQGAGEEWATGIEEAVSGKTIKGVFIVD